MRRKNPRQRTSDQLILFPPSAPVRWTDVPVEARARAVMLLARLLRQHARAHRVAEVRDE
jgi:hypothetical protein